MIEKANPVSPLTLARPSRVVALSAALALLSASGCAVGPDFEKPAAPNVSDYTARPLSGTAASAHVAGGQAQRFARGGEVPGDWWKLFHCKPLDDLIAQALAGNPDLKAAQAALSVARENVLAQRGARLPSVAAGFSATREQDPSGALAAVPSNDAFLYNLFTTQVSVSYVPDVFGLNRRTVESLQAQKQAVRYQMIATYNTLIANVVVTAIQEAAVQAQIEATHQIVDSDTHMLQILQYQYDKGYASGAELAAQKSQLAQAAATLPPLVKQLGQLQNLLAALAGRFPSQAPAAKFELASLQLPETIPVSLPSKLVTQRPDVLQAEANLHAASAQIGIAVANRLPNIELSANAGSTSLVFDKLFAAGTGFWNLGAALTAPIFEGGTLLHQERAAKAAYQQAAAQYRSTVLTAFQNVADTLTALVQDAEALKAAVTAADAAKVALDAATRQVRDGYAGRLALLNAEQAYQAARINLVQAQADRFSDTAALYQALGGGWWNHMDSGKVKDEK